MLYELSEYVSADISDFWENYDGDEVNSYTRRRDALFAKIRKWLKVGP
jgi:hypothetical protein